MIASVAPRINAERLVLLGWSRAILLQIAHPLIAAGVYDHSSFRARPITAIARLHHTVRAMLALTFGSDADRQRTLDEIRAIHRRVHGCLAMDAGPFKAGTPYSAEDPELVLWVHVTLLESIPIVYDLLVSPLSAPERDIYCAEAASVALELGARTEDVPRTWDDACNYRDRMYASGRLTVTPQALEIGHAVLEPRLAWLAGPFARINRLLTIGLLDAEIRRQYRLDWTARDQRALDRIVPWMRSARVYSPQSIALWPEARRMHQN